MSAPSTPDAGWMGDRKRGASLGRSNTTSDDGPSSKLSLTIVRLDSGGYDQGGSYWGHGGTLYYYTDDDGRVTGYVRVTGYWLDVIDRRDRAKAEVRKTWADAEFKR